jgi:hypothetical protein
MVSVTVEGLYFGGSRGEPNARRYVDEVRQQASRRIESRAWSLRVSFVFVQNHDHTEEPFW